MCVRMLLTAHYTDRMLYGMNATTLHNTRKRLHLTQAALARLLGVAENTVARMERGEMGISEPMARLLLFVQRDIDEGGGKYSEYLAAIRRKK
jgi:transcriptional regulator with XRE-family HTH domain